MKFTRLMVAMGAVLLIAGCSKSNPLLGKWKLAPNSPNECFQMGGLEFADKTMTMATPLAPVTSTVIYSHDGDTYSATMPNGMVFSFQTESSGLKSVNPDCHLVPDK